MPRRTGDTVEIGGDYQYRALTQGPRVQRFWHYSKHLSIRKYLPTAPGEAVIDVGCGSGTVASFLGTFGADVLGIDGNPEAIEFATRMYATPNVKFQKGLVDEAFGLADSLDKIYCMEVIEHIYLPQAEQMLRFFYNLLKPGGKVLLTTPNYRSVWIVIEWLMDRFRLSPTMRGEQHVEFYHERKLRRLCEHCGFVIERSWTSCFLAPWLAPLSWRLAENINALEIASPLRLGAVLYCVLAKPEK